ncbi:hypothetical protein AJ80_09415 [Polytolypa hystricis UAMH7299]|uniref:BTB domain-containing protein n=1 Tax=Polytolypa hystricis (strain UAMH7299) TaxID=1447883 RepID=A0A2B7WI75_POLH7|nr:hypothetical protein AJ80_09415 [Polytolypa hystricis UAMH7299]
MDNAKQHIAIDIAKQGDLIVKIFEYMDSPCKSHTANDTPRQSASFRVEKSKLVESSRYFDTMLNGRWSESGSDTIVLHGDTIKSMGAWFCCFHSLYLDSLPFRINIADIRNVVLVGERYGFKPEILHWQFNKWWEVVSLDTVDDFHKPLLPSYYFSHAKSFKDLTKSLVYRSNGYITHEHPTSPHQTKLPARLIPQLNSIKHELLRELHRGLFGPTEDLIVMSRSCVNIIVSPYLSELQQVNVKLSDLHFPRNINRNLNALAKFNWADVLS